MPYIKPFKGLAYNTKVIKNISSVVAPPYDIIPPVMQDELYRKSGFNVVRLILGRKRKDDTASDNRYTRSGKCFEEWLKNNILVQDKKDALYIYSQRYEANGKGFEQIGFIGLMKLNLGRKKTILPHENTLSAPKADRLELMRNVRSNLSPIFVLYDDTGHKVLNILKRYSSKHGPFMDINFDNARHRVWRLEGPLAIKKIEALMRPKDIFIADGHHRYEAACAYSREIQKSALPKNVKLNSRYMMAYFVESDEKMLAILPTHRVIKNIGELSDSDVRRRLEKYFLIKEAGGLKPLMAMLDNSKNVCAFGLYAGKGLFYLLRLKNPRAPDSVIANKSKPWKRLDVTILHLFLLEHVLGIKDEEDNIEFVKDASEAVSLIDTGKYGLTFFLNPTKVSQVKQIARIGERMPRKATYFYPKPASGLIINKME